MARLGVVADALRYQGHPYTWGAWDCSGFVNHVFGEDEGLAIPGYGRGAYHGPPPHGPVVADWAGWPGASDVTRPAPGDVVVWYYPGIAFGGHIGIYLGGGRVISALNSEQGTVITALGRTGDSTAPRFRRVTGAPGGGGGLPGPAPRAAAGRAPLIVLLLLIGLGAAAIAAAAVGAAAAAGIGFTKAARP
jgi:hypothetical protein